MLARDPVKTSNLFASLNQQKERSLTSARRSVSGSSTASTDTAAATTPTSSGDKKKRRKKKKSTAGTGSDPGAAAGAGASNNDAHGSRSSTAPAKKSIFATGGGDNQDESADPSQLPLGRRLEVAAAHGDIHAALVGLLGWSRLYVGTDTIREFFASRALELLLANVFRARPAADAIFDNLQALLANCLSSPERDADVAGAVVAAVRAVVRSASSTQPELVSVDKMAQYVSRLLVQYRLSLSGGGAGSDAAALSQELLRVDAELAAAAARDGAVQGQTIRDTFQRRDIRCDALALYEVRAATVQALVRESVARSTQHVPGDTAEQQQQEVADGLQDSSSDGFAAFASADDTDDDAGLADFDPNELAAIKQHMRALDERKAAALAPLNATRDAGSDALLALTTRRAELEAQLRALNREIEDQLLAQQDVDEQVAAVEDAFEAEAARFDAEHRHVLQHFARRERRAQVAATFAELQAAVAAIALARSDVASLKAKRAACLRQHLEGVLRYFASELPCVQFMRARMAQAEAQLAQHTVEAESYRALGVSAVAKELLVKASALQMHVDEDRQCLEALCARDVALLATVQRLLHDAEHAEAVAALDPALRKEVQRHVDYVAKLHEAPPDAAASANGHSEPRS
ncbi:hypothetical protein PybrP1_005332 [[Pythium] brassicae (nom. inval.)]|nr:hypothetical protein PybrP1_005332 [[Pythium] brassicae (nom. inval.)]